jgi:hypothetical protein
VNYGRARRLLLLGSLVCWLTGCSQPGASYPLQTPTTPTVAELTSTHYRTVVPPGWTLAQPTLPNESSLLLGRHNAGSISIFEASTIEGALLTDQICPGAPRTKSIVAGEPSIRVGCSATDSKSGQESLISGVAFNHSGRQFAVLLTTSAAGAGEPTGEQALVTLLASWRWSSE